MSTEPVTAGPDWPLVKAVRVMIRHGVNRLPVVEPTGRCVGVLTRDDVLRVLAAGDRRPPAPGPARG